MSLKCEDAHQLVKLNNEVASCVQYGNLLLNGYFDSALSMYSVREPECSSQFAIKANGCLCANGVFETMDGSCSMCAADEDTVTAYLGTRGITRFCVAEGSKISPLQSGKTCSNFDAHLHFCPCASGELARSNGDCVAFTRPERFAESCVDGYWYEDAESNVMCLKSIETPLSQIKQSYQNNFSMLRILLIVACAALLVAVVVILLLLIQEFKKKKQFELRKKAELQRLEAERRRALPIEIPTIASEVNSKPKSILNAKAYPVNTIRLGNVEAGVKLTPMKLGGSQPVPIPETPLKDPQSQAKRKVKKRILEPTTDVVRAIGHQDSSFDIFSGLI